MGKKILVIGGGFIGGIIAKDLKQAGYTVSVADFDAKLAEKFEKQDIGFVQVDVTDSKSVKAAVEDFDVVAGAVPSKFGFAMTKAVIEAGKPLADVSFTPEDARQLSALAKEKGVPVVIDCGFAPGMPNLVWGRAIENQFSSIEDATYYVGGIPEKKRPPWNYVSTWCVEDTIEEFTRPARVKRDNQIVTLPAASDLEPKTIDELKDVELEAFVTDGLRSLLDLPIPAMQEKTLRYPGHVADMLKLRDSGALSGDKLKSTTEQLANEWKATDEFKRDVVILQSVITGIGKQSGKRARETMTMIDRYDDATQLTAMSRCTAFSVSITAQLLAEGEFSTSGVHPPETLGRDETVFQRYMTLYKQRGIEFKFRVETLE